jgi:hypothetical protein
MPLGPGVVTEPQRRIAQPLGVGRGKTIPLFVAHFIECRAKGGSTYGSIVQRPRLGCPNR